METPVENNQRVFAENENNTFVDLVPESEPHEEHAEHDQNNYVDLVSESNEGITQQTIFHVEHTQSQKKRRRFIPFKYHSKIFKASKKKRHVDDHRISTNSSSYASCRTFKKDSVKSNVSSNTYQDIEECIHQTELTRCNSIASQPTVSRKTHQMTLETNEHGILKVRPTDSPVNRNTRIPYQMEFPKKTRRQAKKYMVIFCMILVCAIISAAIASVFSTKSFGQSNPKNFQQVGNGEFVPKTPSNVSNEEVMDHIDDLRSDMEESSDKIKMKIELLLQILPNKTNMEESLDKTKMNIESLLQDVSNKTDMEESLDKTMMNIKQLLLTLPNKTDMEESLDKTKMNIESLLQDVSNKTVEIIHEDTRKYILKLIHIDRCRTKCINEHDGNYQSCYTCKNYISCSNGKLIEMLCAPTHAGYPTFWDDIEKKCIFYSRTCDPLHVFKKNVTISLYD